MKAERRTLTFADRLKVETDRRDKLAAALETQEAKITAMRAAQREKVDAMRKELEDGE